MKKLLVFESLFAVALSLTGCLSPTGSTQTEQITYAKDIATSTLTELYKTQPEAQSKIKNSKGYIVCYTYAIDWFFIPTENGWGIAVNNATGEPTITKVIDIGIGPGLGVAQMRTVFVFDNEIEFNSFAQGGWKFNGKASAVARFSDEGKATIAGEANLIPGVRAYKIGERGLIAQAILGLSYSWQNAALNNIKK
jgi:lipid-binding SYLF domain-containing protein